MPLDFAFAIACTFLGPSRKRGPPKGYIDAIEARLHQTEALLGIMISSSDDRAQTLLREIARVCLSFTISRFENYCGTLSVPYMAFRFLDNRGTTFK